MKLTGQHQSINSMSPEKMLNTGDSMKIFRRNFKSFIVIVISTVILFILYHRLRYNNQAVMKDLNVKSYHLWPLYVNYFPVKFDWYRMRCFANKLSPKIQDIQENLKKAEKSNDELCIKFLLQFQKIYDVTIRTGKLKLPKPFFAKVSKWLGNDPQLLREVQNQEIVHLKNKFTFEYTAYNPLRGKRPYIKPKNDPLDYIKQLVNETKSTCDFCRFRQSTAEDDLGRIVTDLTATASNTFKYDAYHQLIFPIKCHNPLELTKKEIVDLFMTADKWFQKVHASDKSYRYSLMMWDAFPHGGASQVHPHIQVSVDKFGYYGIMEMIRNAGERYSEQNGFNANYFTDLKDVHNALGLAYQHGSATALAHLTAHKDFEIILMSRNVNKDVFELLYIVVKALNEDLGLHTYSFAGVFPQMGENVHGEMPVFLRIISRGVVNSMNADISSLELFLLYNVNTDPYKVIEAIRKSASKRS